MKFNFKKVTAVATSMLLAGMTAGVATAADYSDNWSSQNVAVVYGTNTDGGFANNINQDIRDNVDFESSGSSASVGEESALIEDGEVYLGEDLSETFDDRDFEDLLTEETLEDSDGDESDIDYNTEIAVSNSNGVVYDKLDSDEYYVHSDKAEDEVPVLHVDLSNDEAYKVTTDFYTAVNFTQYDNSETITIAGQELVIDPNMADEDSDVLKFYESSETVSVSAGESKTVGGTEVEVVSGNIDNREVDIRVDGELYTEISQGDEEGGVYVDSVAAGNVPNDQVTAQLMVGSSDWVIDGSDLTIDDTDVDGVSVDWGTSPNHESVDYITFNVNPSDMDEDYLEELTGIDADNDPDDKVQYLEIGGEFLDPVFNFGMFFEGSEPEVGEGESDLDFSAGGDYLTIDFTNRNGVEHSIQPYEINSSDNGIDISEEWFVSANTTDAVLQDLQEDDIFIVPSDSNEDEVTYIYQIDKLNSVDTGKDEITLVDAAGDGSDRNLRAGDEIEDSEFYLSSVDTSGDADTINITAGENGDLASVQKEIITNNEVSITLDELDQYNGTRNIGVDTNILIGEDTDDELYENSDSDKTTMNATVEADSSDKELQISSVDYGDTDAISNSNTDLEYSVSKLGTYTELDTEDNAFFNVWSPEDQQVEYQVSIATLAEGDDSSGEAGSKAISDDEAYADNDVVIAVGGSCVNAAAAEALGVPEKTCGDAWEEATGAGSGEFYINKFDEAYDGETTAIVVAGYSAGDTKAAGNYLIENGVPDEEVVEESKTVTYEHIA